MNSYSSSLLLRNTKRNIETDKNVKSVKDDFLTRLELGNVVKTEKINNFDRLYGHPLNLHHDPPYLKPPNLDEARAPSYLINETNNKLVDVSGVYFKNKDLPVPKFKTLN